MRFGERQINLEQVLPLPEMSFISERVKQGYSRMHSKWQKEFLQPPVSAVILKITALSTNTLMTPKLLVPQRSRQPHILFNILFCLDVAGIEDL